MEALALTTATTTTNPSHIRFLAPCHTPTTTTTRRSIRNVSFRRKPNKYLVFASDEDLMLDELDKLELKFGRLIGEDPKLTLAKIRSKKLNPHVSYLEVEKSFYKNKGKLVEIEDVSEKGKSTNSLSGVKLVRPVLKEGVKFETDNKPIKIEVKKPSQPVRKPVENMRGSLPNVILRKPTTFNEDIVEPQESSKWTSKPNLLWPSQPVRKPVENMRDSLPNVILRKPTTFNEDIVEPQESKWRSNPNPLLKMGNKNIQDKSSDIDLLKKPEPMSGNFNVDKKQESFADAKAQSIDDIEAKDQRTASMSTEATNMVRLLKKPTQMDLSFNMNEKQESSVDLSAEMVNTEESNYAESMETGNNSMSRYSGLEDCSTSGLQPLEQSDVGFSEKITSDTKSLDSNIKISVEAALQGKPNMLDQSVKATSNFSREEIGFVKHESNSIAVKLEDFLATSPIKEQEDIDWKRVEYLVETGEREEVELISSSIRGFVVSFGSLVGFLPYRSLATRCKFLAFESWLRRKGLDPSKYKQSLGIIGNNGIASKTSLDSNLNTAIDRQVDVDISPDMKLEDLLWIYDQEKLKFLQSFVGQKMKVNVVLADRKSRRLIVSSKPKENEEVVEKKRSLMAKLSIGDIVKCCIKKITYFGIFVEVEGVAALIHQTEVSWDATLDPASYFRVGQIVEAKVHQLDFSVRRIFLSLREMTPDPVIENLEAVNGDLDSFDGRLEAAQEDTEWADVDSLIKELQQFEGIQSVSKGRFFLSQGLVPTFQVYMASVFANEYKLLARSGNKMQEVIVQTSLGKDEMKSAILTCTNRVG